LHGAKDESGDDGIEAPVGEREGFSSAFNEGEVDVASFGFGLGRRDRGREGGIDRKSEKSMKRKASTQTNKQPGGSYFGKEAARLYPFNPSSHPPSLIPSPLPTCATLNASLFKYGSKPTTSHPDGKYFTFTPSPTPISNTRNGRCCCCCPPSFPPSLPDTGESKAKSCWCVLS